MAVKKKTNLHNFRWRAKWNTDGFSRMHRLLPAPREGKRNLNRLSKIIFQPWYSYTYKRDLRFEYKIRRYPSVYPFSFTGQSRSTLRSSRCLPLLRDYRLLPASWWWFFFFLRNPGPRRNQGGRNNIDIFFNHFRTCKNN